MFTNEKEYQTPEWSLTPDELRSQIGFENLTDVQAEQIIETLVRLTLIANNAKLIDPRGNSQVCLTIK